MGNDSEPDEDSFFFWTGPGFDRGFKFKSKMNNICNNIISILKTNIFFQIPQNCLDSEKLGPFSI